MDTPFILSHYHKVLTNHYPSPFTMFLFGYLGNNYPPIHLKYCILLVILAEIHLKLFSFIKLIFWETPFYSTLSENFLPFKHR